MTTQPPAARRAARVKAASAQLHRSRLALHQALAHPADGPAHGRDQGASDWLPWIAQCLSSGLRNDLQATLLHAAQRALQAVPRWLARHPLLGLLASAAAAALLAHGQAAMAEPTQADTEADTEPPPAPADQHR